MAARPAILRSRFAGYLLEDRVIDRRTFPAGTGAILIAVPFTIEAQQTRKVWRIGFLDPGSSPPNLAVKGPFRQGLEALGYVEGQDSVMEFRWAEGHPDRLPELAADLVRARVDVILTGGSQGTMAAKQVVLLVAGSEVKRGIVARLARPAGT